MPENQEEGQDMGKMRALTNEEIVEFLSGPIIARLGTVKPDGLPYITPVWQEYDGEAVYFVPRAKARFMKYIQNNPRICLHCAIDEIPFTRVLFEGQAEIVAGPTPLEGEMLELGRRLARRYLGKHGPTYLEDSKDRPRYLVKLVPEKITSWDGVEWHPKYLDEKDQ
jgi:nitroimidazol reductase NimA-like FMN-containing flavoprotein (pyridoxamine 5'-phosphate oxidase superfamily)